MLGGLFQLFWFSFATHYFISLSMVSSEILQKDVSYKCRRITHLYSKKLLTQLFLSHISHWLTFNSFPVVEPENMTLNQLQVLSWKLLIAFQDQVQSILFEIWRILHWRKYFFLESSFTRFEQILFSKSFSKTNSYKKWNSTLISTISLVLLEKTSFRTPSKFSVLALPPNS